MIMNIKKSNISGKRVFADRFIDKNDVLGIAFIKISNTGNPDKDFKRTKLGKYINHSNNSNVYYIKNKIKYKY